MAREQRDNSVRAIRNRAAAEPAPAEQPQNRATQRQQQNEERERQRPRPERGRGRREGTRLARHAADARSPPRAGILYRGSTRRPPHSTAAHFAFGADRGGEQLLQAAGRLLDRADSLPAPRHAEHGTVLAIKGVSVDAEGVGRCCSLTSANARGAFQLARETVESWRAASNEAAGVDVPTGIRSSSYTVSAGRRACSSRCGTTCARTGRPRSTWRSGSASATSATWRSRVHRELVEQGVRHCDVIGYSMGGLVAAYLLKCSIRALHPARRHLGTPHRGVPCLSEWRWLLARWARSAQQMRAGSAFLEQLLRMPPPGHEHSVGRRKRGHDRAPRGGPPRRRRLSQPRRTGTRSLDAGDVAPRVPLREGGAPVGARQAAAAAARGAAPGVAGEPWGWRRAAAPVPPHIRSTSCSPRAAATAR